MNIDPQKMLELISEKGVSSALAVLFCIFIYYNQKDLQDVNIEQGKDLVTIVSDIEKIQDDVIDIEEDIDIRFQSLWDMVDDKITPRQNEAEQNITRLQEQIKEMQRH